MSVVRRPVGVSFYVSRTVVVCDDGSVWASRGDNGWTQLPSIPGTPAAVPGPPAPWLGTETQPQAQAVRGVER